MHGWRYGRVAIGCLVVGLAGAGCGATSSLDVGSDQVASWYGANTFNWVNFPDYQQCIVGVDIYYKNVYGATVNPGLCGLASNGSCASCGACLVWLDNTPDATKFNRYAWGTTTPQAEDIAIFPPYFVSGATQYGHAALVDHWDGTNLWIMDDNWNGDTRKANCSFGDYVCGHVHISFAHPYGLYRLKSKDTGGGSCSAFACGSTYYWTCESDGNLHSCNSSGSQIVTNCGGAGCHSTGTCTNDVCNTNCSMYACGTTQYWTCSTNGNLYKCDSSGALVETNCGGAGCHVTGTCTNDVCNVPAACAPYACGTTYYWTCGSDGNLHECNASGSPITTTCPYGCHVTGTCTNDVCNAAPPPPPPPPDAGTYKLGDAGNVTTPSDGGTTPGSTSTEGGSTPSEGGSPRAGAMSGGCSMVPHPADGAPLAMLLAGLALAAGAAIRRSGRRRSSRRG